MLALFFKSTFGDGIRRFHESLKSWTDSGGVHRYPWTIRSVEAQDRRVFYGYGFIYQL
jgi:hypothetical protein